jgi:restriction endonuclease Mrr
VVRVQRGFYLHTSSFGQNGCAFLSRTKFSSFGCCYASNR